MSVNALKAALTGVDWNANVANFAADDASCEKIAEANKLLSLWSHQIQSEESSNGALSFLREMQVSGQNVAALMALGLYKPAAASMRTAVESAMYYSYFRTHPAELATLVRVKKYYITKADVIDYHKEHTVRFSELQATLNLIPRLDDWYRSLSAIVHGQLPGSWSGSGSLVKTSYAPALAAEASDYFLTAASLVNSLFLSTFAGEIWHGVSKISKKAFLRGLTGDQKTSLGLDSA
jgi:hypothetical protein